MYSSSMVLLLGMIIALVAVVLWAGVGLAVAVLSLAMLAT